VLSSSQFRKSIMTDKNTSVPANILSARLQPFVDDNIIAGAVMAVASKDKTLALEAVGYSDWTAKVPMKTDDVFWVASMAKPVTATGLMILVDEGKVSLDDEVEKYIPAFKGQMVVVNGDDKLPFEPGKRPFTIREILSHTSGLPFCTKEEGWPLDALTLEQAVATYTRAQLISQPGTTYSYSNAGINTAGRIIEIVSGMSYEDFMEERLFRPLGMKDTTFFPTAGQVRRLAHAYKPAPAPQYLKEVPIDQLTYPLEQKKGRHPVPGGGLFSTGSDLANFCRMILQDGTLEGRRYLSAAAVRTMTSQQTGLPNNDYGLGWGAPDGGPFSHGGAFSTYMGVDPKAGVVRIFLIQIQGPWLDKVGESIFPAFVEATQAYAGDSPSSAAAFRTEGQASRTKA
jgi:CubicO group peptidase (beta-lactamase class C family)